MQDHFTPLLLFLMIRLWLEEEPRAAAKVAREVKVREAAYTMLQIV